MDFWNLRALGQPVLALPIQFVENQQFRNLVVEFLKACRIPWSHNPKICDTATIMKARNCEMEPLLEYAKGLTIERSPDDPSDTPYFTLQQWYPRLWDEWARDKDGAVPANLYGEAERSIELNEVNKLYRTIQFHIL